MNRCDCGLSSCHQTRHNDFFAVYYLCHLGFVVGRDTSHVVVDCGDDWNGFFCDVDVSEDFSGLGDTGQTLMENLWVEMVQMEVDVVFLGTNASTGKDFHSHGSADDISRGQIESRRCISSHESFTCRVPQDTSLTSTSLGHKTSSSIDTSGMELHKFQIRQRQASSSDHSTTITSAGMSRGASLISSTISSSGNNGIQSSNTMDGAVSDAYASHTTAYTLVVHYEV